MLKFGTGQILAPDAEEHQAMIREAVAQEAMTAGEVEEILTEGE